MSDVCRQVCLALAGATECHGERGSGQALRRKARRLRAVQRHERMAVQLALAEKLQHSANKLEPHNAPRGQESWQGGGRARDALRPYGHRRPLPPGMRPAPQSEVAGPQRCDRTVRGTSLGAPSLPCQSWQPTTHSTTKPSRFSCRARCRRRRKKSSGGGERWSKGGEVVDMLGQVCDCAGQAGLWCRLRLLRVVPWPLRHR